MNDEMRVGDHFRYAGFDMRVTKVSHDDHGFFAMHREMRQAIWFSFTEL